LTTHYKKLTKRPFSLLIKPASADCNIRCEYCFYYEKSGLYPEKKQHRMSNETLETLVSGYMQTKQPVYQFGWQGGEPTLMGVDFFRTVVRLQGKYGRPGAKVSNGLQTNGTLITPEMAALFKEYHFLAGISIDGPAEIHDLRRKTLVGTGSYKQVMQGLEELRRHDVEVNVLVLVHHDNVTKPEAVFRHLVDLGFTYHQYIPCVEMDKYGNPLPWSITGAEWGEFLIRMFQIWSKGHVQTVSVRNFDAVLQMLVTGQAVMCTLGRNCSDYFVVEHNGDVYPCDFFVEPELLLGNIRSDSWESLRNSKTYRAFGSRKLRLPGECQTCEYFTLCTGDCPKHRDGQDMSRLCEGIRMFYKETLPAFRSIASRLSGRPNRSDS
jgi:uncharacterized protein